MVKNHKDRIEEKEITKALDELNQEEVRPDSFWKAVWLFVWEVAKVIIISLAIIIPIRYFLIQPFYVKGASMEPTFHDYEYLIINEISYRFDEPNRGDIVVIRDPKSHAQFFIKRIVGLPGEKVTIKDGQVIIANKEYPRGIAIDESSYLDPAILTQGNESVALKNDEFYVLGDNRNSSLDSRIFGPVRRKDIVGRAWIRAWPFSKMKIFKMPVFNLNSE